MFQMEWKLITKTFGLKLEGVKLYQNVDKFIC